MAKSSLPGAVVNVVSSTWTRPITRPFNPAPLAAIPLLYRDDSKNKNNPASPPPAPPEPALPAPVLPPGRQAAASQYADAALSGPPIPPRPSDLPGINTFGRWLKQAPIAGQMWGGIADYLSNIGTPDLSLQNANAAAWDMMPIGTAMKAAKYTRAMNPVQSAIAGGAVDYALPNPFELPDPRRSVTDGR